MARSGSRYVCSSIYSPFVPTDRTIIVQTRVANAFALLPDLSLLGVLISVTPALVPVMDAWKAPFMAPEPPRPEPPTSVDLAAMARTLAESAPSLRFVAIDLSAAKGSSATERAWFRVHEVKSSPSRRVVRVGEEEGRAIAEQMRGFNRYD